MRAISRPIPSPVFSLPGHRIGLLAHLWMTVFATFLLGSSVSLHAQQLGERQTVPGGGFSLRTPEGWVVKKDESGHLLTATESKGTNLQARDLPTDLPIASIIDVSMKAMAEQLDTDAFKTKSGLIGTEIFIELRRTDDEILVRQMIFFFEGRPGHKIFVACGVAADQENKAIQSLFEEVVSTVRIEE